MTTSSSGACRRALLARPCQAGDPPPPRRPLPLLPQVSPTGRVAAQRSASTSAHKNRKMTMNMMTLSQGQQPASGGFRVEVSRGQRIGRVSSEWFARPDDERFLNLPDLYEAVRGRADRAQARTVESRAIQVEASRQTPSGWRWRCRDVTSRWPRAIGALASCVRLSARRFPRRQLPAALSAINLQHGLLSHRAELVKMLETNDGRVELRAVTGPDYGRIWDHELIAAVMKIAGNGTGDTRWKVPGVLDWSTMTHNPFVEVTKDTTTSAPAIGTYSCFSSTISIRPRRGVCRAVRRICISGDFTAGIVKSAQDAGHCQLLPPRRVYEP
ncbi:hypothetical protein ABIF83_004666 [Bradyrhizobium ottawaense]